MNLRNGFNREPKKGLPPAASIALAGTALFFAYRNRQLYHQATHDSLTGEYNSLGFEKYLAKNIPPRAMIYVDSTNQKAVNDRLGHDRGNNAIFGTAQAIKYSLRPDDVMARIGGDEFLVALDTKRRNSGSKHEPFDIVDQLNLVMNRIHRNAQLFLDSDINQDIRAVGFDIAVGGAIWGAGSSVTALRQAAEASMYANKEQQHKDNGEYRPQV